MKGRIGWGIWSVCLCSHGMTTDNSGRTIEWIKIIMIVTRGVKISSSNCGSVLWSPSVYDLHRRMDSDNPGRLIRMIHCPERAPPLLGNIYYWIVPIQTSVFIRDCATEFRIPQIIAAAANPIELGQGNVVSLERIGQSDRTDSNVLIRGRFYDLAGSVRDSDAGTSKQRRTFYVYLSESIYVHLYRWKFQRKAKYCFRQFKRFYSVTYIVYTTPSMEHKVTRDEPLTVNRGN